MKVIDITDKLNFAEKPKIRIKDVDITVNNSAAVILEILPKLNRGEKMSPSDITDIIKNLISAEDTEKLKALELSLDDFMTFITEAIKLITGGDDDEGEAQTRTTTSPMILT